MKSKEGDCGAVGTSRDFARAGSFGDTEQQADQQIAPEQSKELLSKIGSAAIEQSGFLGAGHEFSQSRAARLTPDRIEGPRHLRRMDGLGDRQSENRYYGRITDLANKLSPERRQHMRERFAIAWHVLLWPFDANAAGLGTVMRDGGTMVMFAGTPSAHLHICRSPWDGNEYHPGDHVIRTLTYAPVASPSISMD
jgi:hypothetical protein